jgi:hypothetical protein
MKNRLELAQYFAKLGFKEGAEIGVCKGIYSKVLLDTIPDVHLYSIDSWEKWDASGACYEITKKLLAPYPKSTIIKATSMNAVKTFKDESLDFVFIDAGHSFVDVWADLFWWPQKVKKGGIVSGHDWQNLRYPSVTFALEKYIKRHNIKLEIIGPDLVNRSLEERQPSWYFLKV